MRLRLASLTETTRRSLFFVPMLSVLAGIGLGLLALAVDSRIDEHDHGLPLGLTSTVESARSVLSTIAGATITFAGIAFSISLLVIQLASSQYSPRVVHTLFRDPFNKRVMGLVVGTFTYCVIVLRSVRSPLEEGGAPIIPNLSVALAVVLGIATILAIVAFIDHSAHTMDVSTLLERVRRDAVEQIRHEWRPAGEVAPIAPRPPSGRAGHVIRFDRSGWVQHVDVDELLTSAPDGSTIHLETWAGRYAIEGTRLATVVPAPADPDPVDAAVRAAVGIGDTRTMQQDASYGLRQLADVALKALSPGVNDPTTAQDAIFHTAAVLAELLRRDPPPAERTAEPGRRVVVSDQPTHRDLVHLAFEETRQAAAAQPTVCVYLLESLHLLHESLVTAGLTDRTPVLREQAELVRDGAAAADLILADRRRVEQAYHARFGPDRG